MTMKVISMISSINSRTIISTLDLALIFWKAKTELFLRLLNGYGDILGKLYSFPSSIIDCSREGDFEIQLELSELSFICCWSALCLEKFNANDSRCIFSNFASSLYWMDFNFICLCSISWSMKDNFAWESSCIINSGSQRKKNPRQNCMILGDEENWSTCGFEANKGFLNFLGFSSK